MARIQVQLPGMLVQITRLAAEFSLEAGTAAEGFAVIQAEYPQLARQVFDEEQRLRRHVLCFCDGVNTRWLTAEQWRAPLRDGATLMFMQAVSGG